MALKKGCELFHSKSEVGEDAYTTTESSHPWYRMRAFASADHIYSDIFAVSDLSAHANALHLCLYAANMQLDFQLAK